MKYISWKKPSIVNAPFRNLCLLLNNWSFFSNTILTRDQKLTLNSHLNAEKADKVLMARWQLLVKTWSPKSKALRGLISKS